MLVVAPGNGVRIEAPLVGQRGGAAGQNAEAGIGALIGGLARRLRGDARRRGHRNRSARDRHHVEAHRAAGVVGGGVFGCHIIRAACARGGVLELRHNLKGKQRVVVHARQTGQRIRLGLERAASARRRAAVGNSTKVTAVGGVAAAGHTCFQLARPLVPTDADVLAASRADIELDAGGLIPDRRVRIVGGDPGAIVGGVCVGGTAGAKLAAAGRLRAADVGSRPTAGGGA